MTYNQAAELTWSQLMHALGIEPDLADMESARVVVRQNEIFDRIRILRRCLPIELLRIPSGDLETLIRAETGETGVKFESFLNGLKRYAAA